MLPVLWSEHYAMPIAHIASLVGTNRLMQHIDPILRMSYERAGDQNGQIIAKVRYHCSYRIQSDIYHGTLQPICICGMRVVIIVVVDCNFQLDDTAYRLCCRGLMSSKISMLASKWKALCHEPSRCGRHDFGGEVRIGIGPL